MLNVLIQRESNGKDQRGLLGTLSVADLNWEFKCMTLELPWHENKRCVSCIPPGVYPARRVNTSKGLRYRLDGVPGRSGILIHVGNWAGDVSAGLKSDSQGCILLGLDYEYENNQIMLKDSTAAVKAFESATNGEDLKITVRDFA